MPMAAPVVAKSAHLSRKSISWVGVVVDLAAAGGVTAGMATEMVVRGEPWRRQEEEHAEADRDLDLFRSGSAPPTVEGSMGALQGAAADLDLRADLAYHTYYYSNANVNPRLPPPLLSKEDWRSAQRLRAGTGGFGDGSKPRGGTAGDGLIGMPGLEIARQQSLSAAFQDDSYQLSADGLGTNANGTNLLGSTRTQCCLCRENC